MLCSLSTVLAVEIATKARSFVVTSGQTLSLKCEVVATSFNLFDNPVVWYKTQDRDECQISMMGNTLGPFASDLRFRPSYHQLDHAHAIRHLFELTIHSKSGSIVRDMDSGPHALYICHLRHCHTTWSPPLSFFLVRRIQEYNVQWGGGVGKLVCRSAWERIGRGARHPDQANK